MKPDSPADQHLPGRNSPRRLSRRAALQLMGAATGGAALAACNRRPGASGTDSGKVELVYQDWRTEWFPPMVQEMLDEFHATHPNIRVYFVPDPENAVFAERMLSDFQRGTAPDVFQGCCTHFPIWAQRGYALDLRPYVKADLDADTIADWDPVQYRSFFTASGLQYGLPKYHGALALFYNKDRFDDLGVDYPDDTWTHDDYRIAMRRLTGDHDGDGKTDQWGSLIDISWDRVQVHVNAFGGHLVDPQDPTKSMMCAPESMTALRWLHDCLWSDRVMATLPLVREPGTREAFVAGRVAMVEDGSWALKDILTGARFRLGVAPLPAGPARRVTLATTDGFGIYAGTRHPQESWELLKFLIGKDYGRAMARANFLQPARESLVEDWVGYIRSEFPQAAGDVDIAAFAEGHRQGYSVVAEVFANMEAARRITDESWNEIFTLGRAPLEELGAACTALDASGKG
jgi:multiple sugar transport system substrate-binding protein